MDFSSTYSDAKDWLSKPFTRDISPGSLILFTVLFIIAIFIAYDSIRILQTWMKNAADAVLDATP